jgi:glycosyltransferase involved in cell wall biosynthesis
MSRPGDNRVPSIALVNPLGDYGINAYTFELAEGLAANGVRVDFYTNGASPLNELPAVRRHSCYPVLGSVLFKQREVLRNGLMNPAKAQLSSSPAERTPSAPAASGPAHGSFRDHIRQTVLGLELPLYLKKKGYDLVWTQWPDIYGQGFWRHCKLLGLQTAHTVHNVLPHEASAGNLAKLRRVYDNSDFLIVHSEHTKDELLRLFPEAATSVIVARHGTYTAYQRIPEARDRVREELKISPGQVAGLICGGIRPYKNIDGVLQALADPKCAEMILIVAGEESGYPDSSPHDRLARTRRLAQELGVADRVRLIPRFLHASELAELFEAADVLVLPYVKNYGSGLLLLGMTFGKHIAATNTGGAAEYLALYPRHTLLKGIQPHEIAVGLGEIIKSAGAEPKSVPMVNIPELQWSTIAHNVLTALKL